MSLKPPVFLGFRCCYVCSDGICENLPLASSFCPGHLSVAGTCSSNMGPWLSHLLTQSVRFARLIWLVRVCTFLRRQFKLMHYTPESTSFVQPNLQSWRELCKKEMAHRRVQCLRLSYQGIEMMSISTLRLSGWANTVILFLLFWGFEYALSDRFGLVLWSLFPQNFNNCLFWASTVTNVRCRIKCGTVKEQFYSINKKMINVLMPVSQNDVSGTPD